MNPFTVFARWAKATGALATIVLIVAACASWMPAVAQTSQAPTAAEVKLPELILHFAYDIDSKTGRPSWEVAMEHPAVKSGRYALLCPVNCYPFPNYGRWGEDDARIIAKWWKANPHLPRYVQWAGYGVEAFDPGRMLGDQKWGCDTAAFVKMHELGYGVNGEAMKAIAKGMRIFGEDKPTLHYLNIEPTFGVYFDAKGASTDAELAYRIAATKAAFSSAKARAKLPEKIRGMDPMVKPEGHTAEFDMGFRRWYGRYSASTIVKTTQRELHSVQALAPGVDVVVSFVRVGDNNVLCTDQNSAIVPGITVTKLNGETVVSNWQLYHAPYANRREAGRRGAEFKAASSAPFYPHVNLGDAHASAELIHWGADGKAFIWCDRSDDRSVEGQIEYVEIIRKRLLELQAQ